jgi:hypothetical protein
MIYFFLGGIGSGKSVSAIREIVEKKQFVYTNFKLKHFKEYQRLKVCDIIKTDITREEGRRIDTKKTMVNWEFWQNATREHKEFSIYLDEIQYLASSRSGMSKKNKIITLWLSQIRKVFGDNPHANIYLITQRFMSADVIFRELAHAFIVCKKLTICPQCETIGTFCKCGFNPRKKDVYIQQYIFDNANDVELMDEYAMKHAKKGIFLANPYFKYYDTGEIIFDEAEVYI